MKTQCYFTPEDGCEFFGEVFGSVGHSSKSDTTLMICGDESFQIKFNANRGSGSQLFDFSTVSGAGSLPRAKAQFTSSKSSLTLIWDEKTITLRRRAPFGGLGKYLLFLSTTSTILLDGHAIGKLSGLLDISATLIEPIPPYILMYLTYVVAERELWDRQYLTL